MRRFREVVTAEEKRRLAEDLTEWGYPRELDPDELSVSCCLRWGEDVIAWLVPDETPGLLTFHLCIHPQAQRRLVPRRLLTGIEVVAELLGAERIAVVSDPVDEIWGYCQRLGWHEDMALGVIIRDLGRE